MSQNWLPWQHPSAQPDPHLRHDSYSPSEPITQTASRSVQAYSHRGPQSVPILYNGMPLSPSKLPLPMGDLDPHLIHGSLGPPRVHNPNGISIGSAVFAGLTSVTDRTTDHVTRSVTIVKQISSRRYIGACVAISTTIRHSAHYSPSLQL